jgi:hypothetical protein
MSETESETEGEAGSESGAEAQTVDLPWIDEPVELAEAVEMIARADQDDEDVVKDVSERVEALSGRVDRLEDASSVSCPSCGETDAVYKAGVGAALLANDGNLSEKNAAALNRDSHVCLDCRKGFTPSAD